MTVNTENIVTSFIQSLQADGKGPKTILSYSSDVRAFLQWLEVLFTTPSPTASQLSFAKSWLAILSSKKTWRNYLVIVENIWLITFILEVDYV